MERKRRGVRSRVEKNPVSTFIKTGFTINLATTGFYPAAFRAGLPHGLVNKKGESRDSPYDKSGNDLLSHTVTRAVPLAQKGLTAEFGMGSGVTPSL